MNADLGPTTRVLPTIFGAAGDGDEVSADGALWQPPAEEAYPAVGSSVAGFVLEAELGRGAFGRVYLGRQPELAGRLVALKVSPAAHVAEARTLARLQHTHIVPVFSLHPLGPLVGLCMPYYRGPTLATLIHARKKEAAPPRDAAWLVDRLGPLDVAAPARLELARGDFTRAVLWVGLCLADGLAHAHERGIVHRDVKPANVLLTDEGVPMLLDFNLAGDDRQALAARAGGTLGYMAPEALRGLMRGEAVCTPAVDVYGLGVVLYELLTGRSAFSPAAGADALAAQREQGPPSVVHFNPAVTPAAAAIIRRCLEPGPARRYAHARQLHDDLSRHLADLPLRHTPEPCLRERAAKWSRRHPRATAAGLLALVAAVVIGAMSSLLWGQARTGAALQARHDLTRLADDARILPALLASPEAPPAQRVEGEALALRHLERWGLTRHGEPPHPAEARHDVAIVAWLWVRARLWARPGPEELKRLLLVNARARAGLDDAPPALSRQRADLLRLAGEVVPDDVAARASAAPATPRAAFFALLERAGDGFWAEALPALQEAARDGASREAAWLLLSSAHFELGEIDKARFCAEMASAMSPGSAWAWAQRGAVNLAARRPAEAVGHFREALRLMPGHGDARLNLSLALLQSGKPAEALRELDALVADGPALARVWFIRAQVRIRLKDVAGARADQQRGLDALPADELGWSARASARLPDDPLAALADLDRALEAWPRSRLTLRNKAHVLSEHLKRPAEAIAALDRAIESGPHDLIARAGRAVLLARAGRPEAARDADLVAARAADGSLLYQAACAYALAGKRDEAMALLWRAFRDGPTWVEYSRSDRDLRALHESEAFKALIRRARDWHKSPAPSTL